VATWTVALSLACFALVGFVVDIGRVLRERSDAFGAAAAAARAGTQELDARAAVGQGVVRLDEAAAEQAAIDHLALWGLTGEADADGLDVTVTVTGETDLAMLAPLDGMGFPASIAFEASATAHATEAEAGP
jgi:Flp pilus assembly protein TadG